MRDFTFGADRNADRLQAFELNFQNTLNNIVLFDRGNFNGDFDMCSLLLSNFESNFLEVFKSFIASDWKHILVQIVKLHVVAFGYYPQHIRILPIIFNNFIFQSDRYIQFFDGAGVQGRFAKSDVVSVYFDEIFSLSQLCHFILILRRFLHLVLLDLFLLLLLNLGFFFVLKFHILERLFNLIDFFFCFLWNIMEMFYIWCFGYSIQLGLELASLQFHHYLW